MRAFADAEMRGTDVGLVSAHATATPFNDPAEAKALTQVLGDSTHWVVHPMKAQIGTPWGLRGRSSRSVRSTRSRGVLVRPRPGWAIWIPIAGDPPREK